MTLGVGLSSKPWMGKIRGQSCQQSCFIVTFCSATVSVSANKKSPNPKTSVQIFWPVFRVHFHTIRLTADRESHTCVRTCSGSAALKCSDFVPSDRSCQVRGGSSDLSSLPLCTYLKATLSAVCKILSVTPQMAIGLALFEVD